MEKVRKCMVLYKEKSNNKLNLKNIIIIMLMALIIVLMPFYASAKYVGIIDNEVSLTFRKIMCEISLDYSDYLTTNQVNATLTTQEDLVIEYKIDDGEWQTYTGKFL